MGNGGKQHIHKHIHSLPSFPTLAPEFLISRREMNDYNILLWSLLPVGKKVKGGSGLTKNWII